MGNETERQQASAARNARYHVVAICAKQSDYVARYYVGDVVAGKNCHLTVNGRWQPNDATRLAMVKWQDGREETFQPGEGWKVVNPGAPPHDPYASQRARWAAEDAAKAAEDAAKAAEDAAKAASSNS